jgi:hypothetical protein
MTIVLDSEDVEGIEAATKVVAIMRRQAKLTVDSRKKITRLKLIRVVQDYAKLISFEAGHKDFKDAEYTHLRKVKDFVDHVWHSLD